MTLKNDGRERESKKHKRRIQKINCSKCKGKIIVEDEIDSGNFYEIAGIKYIECPFCGQEIII